MLLLDSTDLSVYEVADDTLKHWARLPPSMAFERFEATRALARVRPLSRSPHAKLPRRRRDARLRAPGTRSRVGVGVKNPRSHHRQLPITDLHIGEEFLFLWPVPMAINAYINFKEAARRSIALATLGEDQDALMTFVDAVKAHPPHSPSCLSSLAITTHGDLARGPRQGPDGAATTLCGLAGAPFDSLCNPLAGRQVVPDLVRRIRSSSTGCEAKPRRRLCRSRAWRRREERGPSRPCAAVPATPHQRPKCVVVGALL